MKIRKLYERFCELKKKEDQTKHYNLFNQEIITEDEKQELQKFNNYKFYRLFYLDYYELFSKINNYLAEKGFKLSVDLGAEVIGSHPNWLDGTPDYDYSYTIYINFEKKTKEKKIIIPAGKIPNTRNRDTLKYYLDTKPNLKFDLYYASEYFSPKEICYCDIPEDTDEEILKVLPTIKDIIWQTIQEEYYRKREEKLNKTKQEILKAKQREQKLKQELEELENDDMVF